MTFVASWFTHLVRPTSLLASLNGSDRISPAIGGFYVRASGGSVTLPAAGYDYNSDWTPLLAGLSPARMTTSLAAPTLIITLAGGAIGLFAPVGVVKWLLQTEPEDAGILTVFFFPVWCLLLVLGLLIGRRLGMLVAGGKRVPQR